MLVGVFPISKITAVAAHCTDSSCNCCTAQVRRILMEHFIEFLIFGFTVFIAIDGVCTLHLSSRKRKPTTLTRTGRVANTKLIVELFFCAALRKDHLLIVVGRGKVRLEHDIVEQLLAGCEQNIDLRTPGIMLGL